MHVRGLQSAKECWEYVYMRETACIKVLLTRRLYKAQLKPGESMSTHQQNMRMKFFELEERGMTFTEAHKVYVVHWTVHWTEVDIEEDRPVIKSESTEMQEQIISRRSERSHKGIPLEEDRPVLKCEDTEDIDIEEESPVTDMQEHIIPRKSERSNKDILPESFTASEVRAYGV
ncbi:hypothetical protein L345_16061, partial [Ophiophagus hannah]